MLTNLQESHRESVFVTSEPKQKVSCCTVLLSCEGPGKYSARKRPLEQRALCSKNDARPAYKLLLKTLQVTKRKKNTGLVWKKFVTQFCNVFCVKKKSLESEKLQNLPETKVRSLMSKNVQFVCKVKNIDS